MHNYADPKYPERYISRSKRSQKESVQARPVQTKVNEKANLGFIANAIPLQGLVNTNIHGQLEQVVQRRYAVGDEVKLSARENTNLDGWVMRPDEAGDPVQNDIGRAGFWEEFLNVDNKIDEGDSMHRAHGVAKRFGGSGSGDNVGWWPKEIEEQWTQNEWTVAGVSDEQGRVLRGRAMVGAEEQGVYSVNRYLKSFAEVADPYINILERAIDRHYNDDDVMLSNMSNVQELYTEKYQRHRSELKERLEDDRIKNNPVRRKGIEDEAEEAWNSISRYPDKFLERIKDAEKKHVEQIFGDHLRSQMTHVIDDMTMEYKVTRPGVNRRPLRRRQRRPLPLKGKIKKLNEVMNNERGTGGWRYVKEYKNSDIGPLLPRIGEDDNIYRRLEDGTIWGADHLSGVSPEDLPLPASVKFPTVDAMNDKTSFQYDIPSRRR